MSKINCFIASPPSQDLSFDQCGFAVAVFWVICCLMPPATVYADGADCLHRQKSDAAGLQILSVARQGCSGLA